LDLTPVGPDVTLEIFEALCGNMKSDVCGNPRGVVRVRVRVRSGRGRRRKKEEEGGAYNRR